MVKDIFRPNTCTNPPSFNAIRHNRTPTQNFHKSLPKILNKPAIRITKKPNKQFAGVRIIASGGVNGVGFISPGESPALHNNRKAKRTWSQSRRDASPSRHPSRVVSLVDNVADADFVANSQYQNRPAFPCRHKQKRGCPETNFQDSLFPLINTAAIRSSSK